MENRLKTEVLSFNLSARVTQLKVIATPHVQLVKHAELPVPCWIQTPFKGFHAPLANLLSIPLAVTLYLLNARAASVRALSESAVHIYYLEIVLLSYLKLSTLFFHSPRLCRTQDVVGDVVVHHPRNRNGRPR